MMSPIRNQRTLIAIAAMTASLLCLLHQLADFRACLFDGDEFAIDHVDLALDVVTEILVAGLGAPHVRDLLRVEVDRHPRARMQDDQHQKYHEGLPSSPPSSSRTRALRA